MLFEESSDVLLVLLPDSPRFTAVATTKARLLAAQSTLEQTIGHGLFELFPDNPDDPAATGTTNLRASLERVLATKAADTMAVQKYDIPLPGGGFDVRYWSPRNIPVLSPQGDVIYILHRAIDVTDLARISEEGQELRGRTAELEREVVRRNLELDAANHQLREANGKLSELDSAMTASNRELDAFSYSVAHDLRGPLRSVEGFSQMLAQDYGDRLDAEGRRRLEIVRASAQRMSQLIDDLLRLTQMSRREMRRIPFELSLVVRTVATQLQVRHDRRVDVRIEEGVHVHADPHLLLIVFENLLGNSWKFTSNRAQAEIEFGADRSGGEVRYFVRDNGAGFNMNYASKLFSPFQRLHTDSEFPGTGVGLATVQRIVSRHGGRVWAVGEVDKGATFYFTLGEAGEAPQSLKAVAARGSGV
jgi:signal transduction histidine kinase